MDKVRFNVVKGSGGDEPSLECTPSEGNVLCESTCPALRQDTVREVGRAAAQRADSNTELLAKRFQRRPVLPPCRSPHHHIDPSLSLSGRNQLLPFLLKRSLLWLCRQPNGLSHWLWGTWLRRRVKSSRRGQQAGGCAVRRRSRIATVSGDHQG